MDWAFAIAALCVVIVIHEFGHYAGAVATGMHVERFSVFGIGPAILRLGTFRGTEFVISAIPFGAYVMIQGMEPEDDEGPPRAPDPHSRDFRDKPLWARFVALVGGPAANYLAAFAILFGVYGVAGTEVVEIGSFAEVSAARDAGLAEGDQIVRVGDAEVAGAKGPNTVIAETSARLGGTVDVTVRRGDERLTRTLHLPAEPPALGITMITRPSGNPVPVTTAAAMAVRRPLEISWAQLEGLYKLVTGQLEGDMTGPVGIVRHIKRSAEAGIVPFLLTTAFISTLLGLFNLLPLPALDGGRITFLAVELVTRRRVPGRVEGMVHGIGMIALLLLMVLVTIGDFRGG